MLFSYLDFVLSAGHSDHFHCIFDQLSGNSRPNPRASARDYGHSSCPTLHFAIQIRCNEIQIKVLAECASQQKHCVSLRE
jgi:hypothetical protein